MPNYNLPPANGSISVQDALQAAQKTIAYPARNIMIAGTVLSILAPLCGWKVWLIPVIFLSGVLSSYLYGLLMVPKWRIWAYSFVTDIHQLQRGAELDAILPKQSAMEDYGIMSRKQRTALRELQQRFSIATGFVDDPIIEPTSKIYSRKKIFKNANYAPSITISNQGILAEGFNLQTWDDIQNERVAVKSFSRMNSRTGLDMNAGNKACLAFNCKEGYAEISLAALDITNTQLDFLLYIYRGRYEQNRAR